MTSVQIEGDSTNQIDIKVMVPNLKNNTTSSSENSLEKFHRKNTIENEEETSVIILQTEISMNEDSVEQNDRQNLEIKWPDLPKKEPKRSCNRLCTKDACRMF